MGKFGEAGRPTKRRKSRDYLSGTYSKITIWHFGFYVWIVGGAAVSGQVKFVRQDQVVKA